MVKKLNRKKAAAYSVTFIALVLLAFIAGYTTFQYFNSKEYVNAMLPGTIIEGIDVSGKSKEEAIDILKAEYGDIILEKAINIVSSNKTYSISYSKLKAKYDIEDAVNKAYSYGRNINAFNRYKLIRKPSQREYSLKFIYDSKIIKDNVQAIKKEIDRAPVNASVSITNKNTFAVTPEKKGIIVRGDLLEKEITDKLNSKTRENITVNLPLEDVQARITQEKLTSINSKIATFSTDFSTSSEERATNITLATKSINGTVLLPGDSFSFNNVVGERTVERGYKEAPVIIGNKVDSGLGGGICQVSSTLYNSVMRANIKATERTHHTLASSYVGLGLDATVDWGNIDYKFKNTLDYPIYIEGYTYNRVLYFNIYSNSSLTKKTYEIVNEVYETIPAKTKEVNDSSIPEGQVEVVQKAYNGAKVKVYKNTYENGKIINQELLYSDYYKEVEGLVKKGTKKN